METIKELKKQNQKLKDKIKENKDHLEVQKEKKKLIKENKNLFLQQNYGWILETGQVTKRFMGELGKKISHCGKILINNQIVGQNYRGSLNCLFVAL